MSQSPIYLSQIKATDFRTLGKFELDLPPCPGVTIVSGSNGLGKTNLFGALEWALTGNVQRLADEKGSPVEKRDALRRDQKYPPTVRLQFTNDIAIERTETEVSPGDYWEQLMAPEWRGQDFNTAFRFTHLLTQSAKQQMMRMDDNDRWTYLGGLTHLHQVWQVRRKVTAAFTRHVNQLIKQAEADIDQSKRRAEEWAELLARRERLQELARADQALTPEAADAAYDALLARLTKLVGPLGMPVESTLVQRVDSLHTVIAQGQLDAQTRAASLQTRRDDVTAYAARQANIATVSGNLTDIENALAVAKNDHEAAKRALTDAEQAKISVLTERQTATQRFEWLTNLRRHYQHADERSRRLVIVKNFADETKTRLEAAVKERDRLRLAEDRSVAAANAVTAAQAQVERVTELSRRVEALALLDKDRSAQMVAWTGASERVAPLQTTLDDQSKRSDGLLAEISLVEARLEVTRQKADIIAGAVATIAEAMSADRCDCPVCSTEFDKGRLKELALAAAQNSAPDLAADEALLERLRKDQSELRSEQATTKEALDRVKALSTQCVSAEAAWQQAADALKAEPEFAAAPGEDLPLVAARLVEQARQIQTDALAQAQSLGTPAAAREAARHHQDVLNAAEKEDAAARTTVVTLTAEISDGDDAITDLHEVLKVPEGLRETLPSVISAATDELQTATDRVAQAEATVAERLAAVGDADRRLEGIQQRKRELEATRESEREQAAAIAKVWREAGLGETIDVGTLTKAIDANGLRLQELVLIGGPYADLLKGIQGWEHATELRECETAIARQLEQEKCTETAALDRKLVDETEKKSKRFKKT